MSAGAFVPYKHAEEIAKKMGYYQIDRCPYCRRTLAVRQGVGSDTTIGPPIEPCPYCKREIATNRTEWADKGERERRAYYLRVAWWVFGGVLLLGIGGGLFLTAILSLAIEVIPEDKSAVAGIALCATCSLLVAFLTIRNARGEISESLKRQSKPTCPVRGNGM